jgi:hypothetical protein
MKVQPSGSAWRGLSRALLLLTLSTLSMARAALAQGGCDNDGCVIAAPEIAATDLSPLLSSLALLGGSVLVLRGRFRRR